MSRSRNWILVIHSCMCLICFDLADASSAHQNGGWEPYSPREEISPSFKYLKIGQGGNEGWLIHQDNQVGQIGAWSRNFEVKGGNYYRISALCLERGLSNPRANRYVEVFFEDDDQKMVIDQRTGDYNRPFYPWETGKENGWAKFEGTVYAPIKAKTAIVRLFLRWEPNAKVEWSQVQFEKVDKPKPRKVRLAATNFRPSGGKTTIDNCRMLEPFAKEAGGKKVDLLVFGECISTMRNGLDAETGAEEIPGPCVKYLGKLAKKNDLYLVTSLFERDGEEIYNTAVILGPDGKLIGKYRKLCLARDEYREGITPGKQFPVFNTRFGKVGLMICFDVHMPEVARGIAANGAEIIAMPIMGGHPILAKARAIENQVYLVTSTYSLNDDWMQTGIWDRSGELHARATKPNQLVIHEIDLAEPFFWRGNIGNFQNRLRHERPSFKLPK